MSGTLHVARVRLDRRRCPLCFEPLPPERDARACDACATSYHPACFVELGGCGTSGCERSVSSRRVRARVRLRLDPRRGDWPSSVCGVLAAGASLLLFGVGGVVVTWRLPDLVSIPILLGGVLAVGGVTSAVQRATGPAGRLRGLVPGVCGTAAAVLAALVGGLLLLTGLGQGLEPLPELLVLVAILAAFMTTYRAARSAG